MWNGLRSTDYAAPVSRSTKVMEPEPELHFQPDPQARYDVVDQVLAIIKNPK